MSDPIQQLDLITEMIGEARDAVQTGQYVDLAEIQGLVQEVCASIQDTPPDDGGLAQEKIVAMIENLNQLADELTDQKKHAGSEVIRRAVRKNYTKRQDN